MGVKLGGFFFLCPSGAGSASLLLVSPKQRLLVERQHNPFPSQQKSSPSRSCQQAPAQILSMHLTPQNAVSISHRKRPVKLPPRLYVRSSRKPMESSVIKHTVSPSISRLELGPDQAIIVKLRLLGGENCSRMHVTRRTISSSSNVLEQAELIALSNSSPEGNAVSHAGKCTYHPWHTGPAHRKCTVLCQSGFC